MEVSSGAGEASARDGTYRGTVGLERNGARTLPEWHLPTAVTPGAPYELRANAGLFRSEPVQSDGRDNASELWLGLIIWNARGTTNGRWLNLAELADWKLDKKDGPADTEPDSYYLAYFPLGGALAATADWRPGWHVLAQVPPWNWKRVSNKLRVRGKVTDSQGRHPIWMILERWNALIEKMETGKMLHAGRPLFALPRIDYEFGNAHRVVPAFHFESATRPGAHRLAERGALEWEKPALRHIFLHKAGDPNADQDGRFLLSFSLAGTQTSLVLAAVLKDPHQAWIPEVVNELAITTPGELTLAAYFEALRDAGEKGDVLCEFSLQFTEVDTAAESEWLRLGAFEFRLPRKGPVKGGVTCRLRGLWDAQHCDSILRSPASRSKRTSDSRPPTIRRRPRSPLGSTRSTQ